MDEPTFRAHSGEAVEALPCRVKERTDEHGLDAEAGGRRLEVTWPDDPGGFTLERASAALSRALSRNPAPRLGCNARV